MMRGARTLRLWESETPPQAHEPQQHQQARAALRITGWMCRQAPARRQSAAGSGSIQRTRTSPCSRRGERVQPSGEGASEPPGGAVPHRRHTEDARAVSRSLDDAGAGRAQQLGDLHRR